jgi:multidrug efflux pump
LLSTIKASSLRSPFPSIFPRSFLERATQVIEEAVRELNLPATISGGFAGNAQVFQQSVANQLILIVAALLAVYIVLGILYESLIHPITILSTLPSAGLGALLALQTCGFELSIVAMIGIILLIGIVKKNAIMMVDFALEVQRTHHLKPEEAIYQACLVRFRPIMMTTFAALFGALPLAIGLGVGSSFVAPRNRHRRRTHRFPGPHPFTTPVVYLALERLRSWAMKARHADPVLVGTFHQTR